MGWANVSDRINGEPFDLQISETACRFENGGLPAPGLYGLTEVLHTYMRLGADDIQEYILSLGDYLRQKIRDIPEVSEAFHFEREHSSNLIMLEVPERLELTGAGSPPFSNRHAVSLICKSKGSPLILSLTLAQPISV